MNQASSVPFGPDATTLAGYAMTANERLGAIDFIFENTGSIPAYIKVMAYVGPTTIPSGYSAVTALNANYQSNLTGSPPTGVISALGQPYAIVGTPFVVNPKGSVTRSYNLLTQRIGFFGSGIAGNVTQTIAPYQTLRVSSTNVNITAVIRNPSDIRGAQIDINTVGRQGWGYDPAFNTPNLTKKWGSVTPSTGLINLSSPNYNEPVPSGASTTGPAGVIGTPA
jgi:hypothetical protein